MSGKYDADILHLGCGEDYHQDAWNVDAVPDVNPDEVYNLEELPWPWPDNEFAVIRAYHLFEHLSDIEAALREAHRILTPGGRLKVKVPIGIDAIADPDHEWGGGNPWTWRTPLFYTGERHWDTDVGMDVRHRDVRLWSHSPSRLTQAADRFMIDAKMFRHGPGEWCFGLPNTSGEFTVVFRNGE